MSRRRLITVFKTVWAPFNLTLRILSLPARWAKPIKNVDGPVWVPPANDERHLWQAIEERRQSGEPRYHLWQTVEQRRAQQAPQATSEPETVTEPEQESPNLQVLSEPGASRRHLLQTLKARRVQRALRASGAPGAEQPERAPRNRRRLLPVRLAGTSGRVFIPVAVIVALAVAAGSYAYFTSTGTGTATGSTGALTPASISVGATGGSVTVTWGTQATTGSPGLDSGISYTVERSFNSGAYAAVASGPCSGSLPHPTASCVDTVSASGTYTYEVIANYGSGPSWTATSNQPSVTVTVAGPLNHFTVTGFTPAAPETAGTSFTVTVTALDASNNPAAGWTSTTACVAFSGPAASPGGTQPLYPIPTGSCTTGQSLLTFNGSGQATATITLYDATSSTALTVTDPVSSKTGNSASFAVTSTGTATQFLVAGSGTQTAGTSNALTITAQDTYGNTESSYAGDKSLTFSGANSIGGNTPTVTNKSGVATNFGTATTITFTAGVSSAGGAMVLYKAETAHIVATQGSITNSPALAVTVSSTGTATKFVVAGSGTQTAGTTNNLTITAEDTYGNQEPSYAGNESLTFSGANSVGGNTPTVTNSSGTAVAFGTATTINFVAGQSTVQTGSKNGAMVLYKAETASIVATAAGPISNSGLTVVVSSTGTATKFVVAGSGTQTAGTTNNLTITAEDTYGNQEPSYAGNESLTFSGANSVGGNTPTVTNSSGTAVAFGTATTINFVAGQSTVQTGSKNGAMVLYKAETASIVATQGSITNSGLTVVVSSAGAATLSVSGYTTPTTAGVSHSFTVTALDAFGNTATGYTGTVTFSATNDAAAVLPSNYTFLAGDAGTKSFNATFKTVAGGTKTLTATDTVTGTITGSQTGITVNPAGAATLSVSGYTTPTTAGVSHSFTVTALDAFGNTATGYTGTVTFSATNDAAAVLPSNYTFLAGDAGTKSFNATFKTVAGGTKTLTATDTVTGTITGSQTGITVNPAGAATLSVSGYTTPTTAGVSHSFTVTALDAFGNTATGYTGTVTFSATNDAAAVLPSNYTFLAGDAGTKSFNATFKTVAGGTKTLTATDTVTGTITGSQTGITVTAATANTIALVSGTPQSATVSTAFTAPLVALVTDAFGNPVSGASVTFAAPTGAVASGTFASSGCTSNSPTTTCVATTLANGQATSSTFTANATAGGPYNVTANATGTNTVDFSLTNTAAKHVTALSTATGPSTGMEGILISNTSISSTLSGGTSPTGTISFSVYGPSNTAPTSCQTTTSGLWTAVGTAPVTANGAYSPTAGFSPPNQGMYWWYASYGGDTNNAASTSTCGSGMDSTVVGTVSLTTANTYTLTIPAGVTSVGFSLKGAGGGGNGTSGGAGGSMTSGTITLSSNPSGVTLMVVVGAGGANSTTGGASGTGCFSGGGGGSGGGGAGGGASCVYVTGSSSTPIAVVGGGGGGADAEAGGAGSGANTGAPGDPTSGPPTGGGGGTTSTLAGGAAGAGGSGGSSGSAGGTITLGTGGGAGGTGASNGNDTNGGGGGGGGYASGGGGGTQKNSKPGGGGGGSGFNVGNTGVVVSTITYKVTSVTASQGGGGAGSTSTGSPGSATFSW